jgi:hypothetical protein
LLVLLTLEAAEVDLIVNQELVETLVELEAEELLRQTIVVD